ncbi:MULTISPECIES: polyhydroxyalkanoic acid system family protein [Pseudomonas]|uniref:Polyhydroxyalkanoic acid system protein n=1 Tax=Pseudomonas marincola TaxID=437900 RepID=A0A1I7AAY5_9PSED|nr:MULTISPECIES: polyhydroxyalkanoic acid system family protein [Pseudomonas]MAB98880.1 polyhydroxyalkanoic acid system protein [Pseudomonadaceae bacterium]MBQ56716.1 polyhydroxyalkanoic acid system protein [Pseudomonadaceae bacterium]NRH27814.1 polyhydroxyalkanoic acid system protein [Pseudomonas sp. MS19]OEO27451.1 polyhydroxyalkanoic acid system protein [Pseudomonas sp. J237]CAE6949303.1 Polyhydroxyalkanoic acid system protein [Pseudomonas marincola]|tara:strand:+ start:202 stop:480 length:279 start_codon:yes stop_codon:yes gene_type:complete
MAKIVVERTHSLGRDAAREKAEYLAERLAERYDVRYRWNGDTLEFKRSGADGSIDVGDNNVLVKLNLGLLLSALSPTIKREIETVLDKHLQA